MSILPDLVRLSMIKLTRINHLPLILNSDLIEHVESTPDTIISLTSGQKLVVLESVDEVVNKVIQFRRAIYAGAWLPPLDGLSQTPG